MKKIINCYLLMIFINILYFNQLLAYSLKFEEILDILEIPKNNLKGYTINEDVYYLYNVFSYSSPEYIDIISKEQRFKEVKNGLWKKNSKKGEYYILGTDFKGNYIYNYKFPVDFIPENYPDKLQYLPFNNNNSWNDKNKYQFSSQLEYMKNSKLRFDKLDFDKNIADSYEQVEYNITAKSIGLNKMLLSTCSTWKTAGIIYAIRKNNEGQYRNMIFSVAPMAVNANINSKLDVKILDENKVLDICFGAQIINLNKYTTNDQVKNIVSKLYINDKFIKKIEQSKSIVTSENIQFFIDKDSKLKNNTNIKLKVESYAYTAFSADGVMKDSIEKELIININKKSSELKDKNIEQKTHKKLDLSVGILKLNSNKLNVSELLQTSITKEANSVGMVEKNRYIVLKLLTNFNLNEFSKIDVYINKNKIDNVTKLTNDKYKLLIPNELENTILSWNNIRQKTGDFFINNNLKIGDRIQLPHKIQVEINGDGEDIKSEIIFDVIDNFYYNINYIFKSKILNLEKFNDMKEFYDW